MGVTDQPNFDSRADSPAGISLVGGSPILARGERVLLRRTTRADIDKRLEWAMHTDPLFRHWNAGPMSDLEKDAWYYTKLNRGDYHLFAVDEAGGKMIGFISLRDLHPEAGQATLGISLDPAFINKGYGTEALETLFSYYFGVLSFRELLLDVAAYNKRAYRCYEKCGFVTLYQAWSTVAAEGIPPQVLTAPQFEGVRQFFRLEHGRLEGLLYHMSLKRSLSVRPVTGE